MGELKGYSIEEVSGITGIDKATLRGKHKDDIIMAVLVENPFIQLNAYDILWGRDSQLTVEELGIWIKMLCLAALSEAKGKLFSDRVEAARKEYDRIRGGKCNG